jgi:hypothetical protein
MRGPLGAHLYSFVMELKYLSILADIADAFTDEALIALGVTQAVTGSVRSDEGAQAPLRRALLRIAAVVLVLTLVAWLLAVLISDERTQSRFAAFGYGGLGLTLAVLFGWAASFGAGRSGQRKS